MQYYTTNISSCHADLQALQNVLCLYQPKMNKHDLLKAAQNSYYFADAARTKVEKTVHNMFFKWFMSPDSEFNHYLPADLLKDVHSYDMADKQEIITQLQTVFAVLGERPIYDFVINFQKFNDYLMDDNDLCYFLRVKTKAQFLEWPESRLERVSKSMSRILKVLHIVNIDEEFNDSFTINHDNSNFKAHDQLVLLISFFLVKNQLNKAQFFEHRVWALLNLKDNDVCHILKRHPSTIKVSEDGDDCHKVTFQCDNKHEILTHIMSSTNIKA